MQALEMRADALDWGDTRYAPQQAAPARARLQLVDLPPDALPAAAPPWQDKLQAVPAMRSALIPLDETEIENWSKPFSLVKADFEPWLSYYDGYRASRLFLEAGRPALDFPVRALLELKKIDGGLMLEPPVRIDAPVEYFDAKHAPGAGRGPALAESLTRAADAMHRSQLRRARERGRDLGNQLHDALLGDGLCNLIRAWEKVHQRKPSPHELHIMLTTGRTTPVKAADVAMDAPPHRTAPPSPPPFRIPAASVTNPAQVPRPQPMPSRGQVEPPPFTPAKPALQAPATGRSGLRYLLHVAGAAGAAALFYVLAL